MLVDHYPCWLTMQKTDRKLFAKYVPDSIHATAAGCAQVVTPAILDALGIDVERIKSCIT